MKKVVKIIAKSLQNHCKIIALYSLFFITLPFWSLGQTKEKEEAERQIAPTLATLPPIIYPLCRPARA